jgi:tripartite-type tricarboxylate transporter receptor subunit TctC
MAFLTRTLALMRGLCPLAATAADEAAFFRDKQMRIVVGSAAGSGYDINARFLGRHYTNHLPGTPNIIAQNQVGAGSVAMANGLYKAAPKDGSVIGAAIKGMPTSALFTRCRRDYRRAGHRPLRQGDGDIARRRRTARQGLSTGVK